MPQQAKTPVIRTIRRRIKCAIAVKKRGYSIFKQAVIYYPKDERVLHQIHKDIAAFHCQTALQFMGDEKYDCHQREAIINSLLQDIRQPSEPIAASA